MQKFTHLLAYVYLDFDLSFNKYIFGHRACHIERIIESRKKMFSYAYAGLCRISVVCRSWYAGCQCRTWQEPANFKLFVKSSIKSILKGNHFFQKFLICEGPSCLNQALAVCYSRSMGIKLCVYQNRCSIIYIEVSDYSFINRGLIFRGLWFVL